MSKKQHTPPRDPFVLIVLCLRESRRARIVEKAGGESFQQWALKTLEGA